MYPYQSLPENLVAFSAQLRREHGFLIGSRELQDAARALGVSRLADERSVRDVLRPVLCRSRADVAVFDRAFHQFFHHAVAVTHLETASRGERRGDSDEKRAAWDGRTEPNRGSISREGAIEARPLTNDTGEPTAVSESDDDATRVVRASYSPLDAEGAAPNLMRPEADWRAAAGAFAAAIRLGLSRRWRPAHHGQRFDLRRTLRHGLHTGGDAVAPRWLARPRRRPRLVMIVDGSRSMSAHARAPLEMAVALATVMADVEVFTFSTTLHRVTRDVRRAAAGEHRRLDNLHRAWGGGTSIGGCLYVLLTRFGERLLRRDTVLVIVSDGLDVGAADVLRETMARLHRQSAGVIWLNPLLDTPGYEPTALGMSAARPYVSTLACVSDPAGLLRLSRAVRLRA